MRAAIHKHSHLQWSFGWEVCFFGSLHSLAWWFRWENDSLPFSIYISTMKFMISLQCWGNIHEQSKNLVSNSVLRSAGILFSFILFYLFLSCGNELELDLYSALIHSHTHTNLHQTTCPYAMDFNAVKECIQILPFNYTQYLMDENTFGTKFSGTSIFVGQIHTKPQNQSAEVPR